MRHATLCFLLKEDKILLGYKKQGFGEGKWNGFGGKVNEGEGVEDAAVRELFEEAGVKTTPENIRKVAELDFHFPHAQDKGWDQIVHVFFTNSWEGEPVESNEMVPKWVKLNEIPFDEMWDDDKHWIPLVLQDRKIKAKFSFKSDNKTVHNMDIKNVEFY